MAEKVIRKTTSGDSDAADPGGAHAKGYSADSGPDETARNPTLCRSRRPEHAFRCSGSDATTMFVQPAARNRPTMNRLRFDAAALSATRRRGSRRPVRCC